MSSETIPSWLYIFLFSFSLRNPHLASHHIQPCLCHLGTPFFIFNESLISLLIWFCSTWFFSLDFPSNLGIYGFVSFIFNTEHFLRLYLMFFSFLYLQTVFWFSCLFLECKYYTKTKIFCSYVNNFLLDSHMMEIIHSTMVISTHDILSIIILLLLFKTTCNSYRWKNFKAKYVCAVYHLSHPEKGSQISSLFPICEKYKK